MQNAYVHLSATYDRYLVVSPSVAHPWAECDGRVPDVLREGEPLVEEGLALPQLHGRLVHDVYEHARQAGHDGEPHQVSDL